MPITVNTRTLQSHLTGVQRYTLELLSRFGNRISYAHPSAPLFGIKGHTWEQLALPLRLRNKLLFSPANTGPLAIRNQVVTIHDVSPLDHPEWMNSRFAAWYRFLTPRLAQRVVHVITDSEFSKQRILHHTFIDERKVTVIPIGVDPRFQPISTDTLATHLHELKIPSRHYVLCVGSLEPRKNLGRLLQAWQRIHNVIPEDVWLVVAGKGGNHRVFADNAGLDVIPPRVHLTGHVPDDLLPALYAGALAFAYPSVYEGFGLPPLEAMASGVPVLTGNLTSLPEVIGEAGLMVDPYDVDEISAGLQKLIDDSIMRQELSQRGLVRAAQFNWDLTASKTWDVLQQAAHSV
ncbi:MAG: glycosyltransferase family 1 protein [Thermodesulfobacteriota bacterium]